MSRLNEMKKMHNGQWATIVRYNGCNDIDIKFEDGFIAYNKTYGNYKKGEIKSGYEKNKYGGWIGYASCKESSGKDKKAYSVWISMLKRCYDEKYQNTHPTYKGVTVCEEWFCFEVFENWFNKNFYEVANEEMHLDKDVLYSLSDLEHKIYSPKTCMFLPQSLNKLFTEGTGVFEYNLRKGGHTPKYQAKWTEYNEDGKRVPPVYGFNTKEEACECYIANKERVIKNVAKKYKELIPTYVYSTLVSYKAKC